MRWPNPPALRLPISLQSASAPPDPTHPSPTAKLSPAGEASVGTNSGAALARLVAYRVGHPTPIDLQSQVQERVAVAVGSVQTVPQACVVDVQQHAAGDGEPPPGFVADSPDRCLPTLIAVA